MFALCVCVCVCVYVCVCVCVCEGGGGQDLSFREKITDPPVLLINDWFL